MPGTGFEPVRAFRTERFKPRIRRRYVSAINRQFGAVATRSDVRHYGAVHRRSLATDFAGLQRGGTGTLERSVRPDLAVGDTSVAQVRYGPSCCSPSECWSRIPDQVADPAKTSSVVTARERAMFDQGARAVERYGYPVGQYACPTCLELFEFSAIDAECPHRGARAADRARPGQDRALSDLQAVQ